MVLLTGTEVASGMTEAITSIMNVVPTVLTTITETPALAVFFFAGVIGIAIGVVKRLK